MLIIFSTILIVVSFSKDKNIRDIDIIKTIKTKKSYENKCFFRNNLNLRIILIMFWFVFYKHQSIDWDVNINHHQLDGDL